MKHIGRIGFLFVALMAGCFSLPSIETKTPLNSTLVSIDCMMWSRPDSAFEILIQFAASPLADSLDTYNENYCQLLISELLYKNDYGQSNREELLKAVACFDTLDNTFLDARAHYINGVGYYEQGEVALACAEYLTALERMDLRYEKKDLVGTKAQFMSLAYNRLGELFKDQYMIEPAIACYEHSLTYCSIKPTSPQGISKILYHIGKLYDMLGELKKAKSYYEQALAGVTDHDSRLYKDIMLAKLFCDYHPGKDVKQTLDAIRQVCPNEEDASERLAYYLVIGYIYFEERVFDSSLYYLNPVFKNTQDETSRIMAAEYLRAIYDSLGNTQMSDGYMHFLADHKKIEGDDKALVSKLGNQYKNYLDREKGRINKQEKRESVLNYGVLGSVLFIVVIVVIVLLILKKSRKHLMTTNAMYEKTVAFREELVCQNIIKEVQYLHITTRDNYYQHKTAFDDLTFKELSEAVERHYHGFDAKLLAYYKDMKQDDFLLCYLYLLNLNEKQIAVLRKCGYSAIKKQSDRLEKRLGITMKLKDFVRNTADEMTIQ